LQNDLSQHPPAYVVRRPIKVTPPTPPAKGRSPLKSPESNPSLITRLASVLTTTSGMVQAKVTLNVSNPPCHANAFGTLAPWVCYLSEP